MRRGARPARTTARALEYVDHGWPVAALAVPWGNYCPCGEGCSRPHLASEVIVSAQKAASIWAKGHRWDIAFVTSEFDVVDVPGRVGALLHSKLITKCPTATAGYAARDARRWHFVVEAGALPPDEVARLDGVVHSGPDDWIAASPTRTPETGRVGWIVEPIASHWTPCTKEVVKEKVYTVHGITGTIATVTDGLG
jgi:hypothetical protein